ncbi:hypothetical protein WJX81_008195 [Elliptochloris bilobata]|uniref:Uncharacterized protein n=1 Tax=Elliptochloris bilobata TaxID=381761 RepID=A0AAW1S536_9CHLO
MLPVALVLALSAASASAVSVHTTAHEQRKIPHFVHQFWHESGLPSAAAHRQRTWKAAHPHWEYKLWTHVDNKQLVAEHYAWFKDTYDSLPEPAMQDEAARFLNLHHYGGMYADLQLVALRATDDLVASHKLVLASAAHDDDAPASDTNEWMASARWHPFWLFAVAQVLQAAGAEDVSTAAVTGAAMLDKAVAAGEMPHARLWRRWFGELSDTAFGGCMSGSGDHFLECATAQRLGPIGQQHLFSVYMHTNPD